MNLITDQIISLAEPILDEMGFELVDVEYLSEHGRWILRLYIDKTGGITVGDCAKVSRELAGIIDIKDIIDNEYVLEVSSPGLNRPLKKEEDFIRVTGEKIKVRMRNPIDGRKNFSGHLKEYKDKDIYLEVDGELVTLSWLDIERANLVYEFNQ
ncbi:ribosome maturation factor RimP [Thermodesulfobacteriota bacterium]